jgi:hypothetical protein
MSPSAHAVDLTDDEPAKKIPRVMTGIFNTNVPNEPAQSASKEMRDPNEAEQEQLLCQQLVMWCICQART